MANRIYFKIIDEYGTGVIALHVSHRRKEIAVDRPDALSKSFRYFDEGSRKVAVKTAEQWREEMLNRFGAIEID